MASFGAPWDALTSGDIVGMATKVYTTGVLAPFAPFFYGLIIAAFLIAIYLKSQNINLVGILGILISGVTIPLVPPETQMVGFTFMALGFTLVLFKLFKG